MPSSCHSLFFHLFYPQGSKLGHTADIWDGFNFQSNIYNTLFRSSLGEKEWFLAEFYVRLKEKQSKTWLIGTLGYGLIFKKWDWREKLFVTLRTHKGWPCLLCAWLLGR